MNYPSFRRTASGLKCASGVFAAIAFFICLTFANTAAAATYTVTNTFDSGAGSLRQAVTDANGTTANDVIVFNIPAAQCSATGVCTITLTTGEITIANNGALTINGTGANRLTISGNNASRIFYSNGATFTLSGVTLTNGNGVGALASGNGGAIYVNSGTLVLRGVNVTGNSASSGGGGLSISSGTNHQIINSTFSGNTTTTFGGGFANGGPLTVTNTTISGNTAGNTGGGGFGNEGTMTLRNSTVSGNTANGGFGGSGFLNYGTINIGNSIIAGNTGSSDINNLSNFGATLTSNGYNLIGDNTNATTQFPAGTPNGTPNANNDIVGTSASPVLAQLAPLAFNGGTVPTRALCTAANVPNAACTGASPAIDQGSAVAGVFSDGRGVIRPFDNPLIANQTGGNGADIGAFELQSAIVKDWGYNQSGQLGLGSTTNQTTPQVLAGFDNITQFGGGYFHSVALRADGSVVTAGDDDNGQLGDGTIGGGNRTTFGAVTVGGNVTNITQVSGGGYHSLALRADKTVWAWGRNANGELGNGSTTNSATPVQVGAGVAGFNGRVVAVSAGFVHNLALTDDGKVWAWGGNFDGQIGDGTLTTRLTPTAVLAAAGGAQLAGIEQIAAGEAHSTALTSSGAVLVWGYNSEGQVGNNTSGASVLYPTQTTNTLMGTAVQISAGSYHNVAVNTLGDVYAWGYGGEGAIGDGNTANALVPRKTSTLANVVRLEAHGSYHTLARQRDGTLFVWGRNVEGQIGNGTATQQNTPLNISAAAGTGGNLGTSIAVFGTGVFHSFAATAPQTTVAAGASTVRGDEFSVAFPASTTAGTMQIRTFDPTATGLTVPSGYTILANSTGYDFTSTAQFTGTATVCLKVPNVISQTAFDLLYILHDDNFDGTLDVIQPSRDYQRRELCRSTTSFSPFVIAQGLSPSSATVTVEGRVTANGRGLRNAVVQITDAQGNTRTARTGSFGYYRFDEVEAGQTYTIAVNSKRFVFTPQVVSVNDNIGDLDFTALP